MIDALGPSPAWARGALVVGCDVAAKATALGLLALALHALAGRRRPLVRSALWNACLIGLLLLPASAAAFPRLRLAWLPVATPAPMRAAMDRPAVLASSPNVEEVSAPIALLPPLERPRARYGPGTWIVSAYLAVAALLAIRLAGSLAAVRALRRSGIAVEESGWVEALGRWRTRLGLSRPVGLVRSDRADVPMVVGWLRPMVVLPGRMAGPADPGTIDAVLLHELAHVRRGDYPWNLLLRLVQVAYWPHPIAWPLGRIIGGVREQACDDICIGWLGDARGYRATLLDVASSLSRSRRGPALGLAMARPSKLGRRLARIERSVGAPRCLLRWPARALIAGSVVAAFVALGTVQLARTAAAQAPKADEPKARADEPKRDEAKPVDKVEAPGALPRVRIVHPKRVDFKVQLSLVCTLDASERVSVYARVAGRVKPGGLVRYGDRVKAGQVIAEIDPATDSAVEAARGEAILAQAEAKLRQAKATVKGAQAALDGFESKRTEAGLAAVKAESALKNREIRLKHVTALQKDHVVSSKEVELEGNERDSARSALDEAKARIKSAEADVARGMAEVEVAQAGLEVERVAWKLAREDEGRARGRAALTKVLAPFDGGVTRRDVEPDSPVRPDDKPLFIIARTDVLTAATAVPEPEAALLDVGDPVVIRLASSDLIEAKVSRVGFEVQAGQIRAEIDIPNPNGRLRSGQSARATITLDVHRGSLVIPTWGVIYPNPTGEANPEIEQPACARVVDGRVVMTPVQVAASDFNQGAEILEGLKESDEVIVEAASETKSTPKIDPKIRRFVARTPLGELLHSLGIRDGSPVAVVDEKGTARPR